MAGIIALLYGAVAYVMFLGSFLYAVGFVGNLAVPKSIDSGTAGEVGDAVIVNVLLLGLFAAQHSVMARPAFKRLWTRVVPQSVERSTYVLLASLVLVLLYWQWRPIPTPVWTVEHPLWRGRALGDLLAWLGSRSDQHFPDQPFRAVRPGQVVRGCAASRCRSRSSGRRYSTSTSAIRSISAFCWRSGRCRR